MKTIKRQSMLYKTGVEYGDYTLNHVQGCAHGCKYPCYAMQMAKRFGKVKTYEDWCEPKLAENALEILDKEIPKLREKINSVHLCFTTDPFMLGYPEVGSMSLGAIGLINEYGKPCSILTKGELPVELAALPNATLNTYGITLVSLDEDNRKRMEPGAAACSVRLAALESLHKAGCKTWVSMEPYPTPNICEQDLDALLHRISFVDKIVFGRTHYDRLTSSYDDCARFYRDSAEEVRDFCFEHGIECHIKRGTASQCRVFAVWKS